MGWIEGCALYTQARKTRMGGVGSPQKIIQGEPIDLC
jgi:hypothetical protein